MSAPRNWRKCERHPLSAAYPDWTRDKHDTVVDSLKTIGNVTNRKIIMHEGLVLDGWQFLQACIEADHKPPFARLKRGADPVHFVKIVNDLRRHEDEAIIQERAERRLTVVKLRSEGNSLRAIAEKVEATEATVRRDLEAMEAAGVKAEPEKIVGKDAKTYDPTAAILCDRCARVGKPVKDCPRCEDARTEARYNRNRRPKKRKAGSVLYDWTKAKKLLGPVMQLPDHLVRVYPDEKGGKFHKRMETLLDEVANTWKLWREHIQK